MELRGTVGILTGASRGLGVRIAETLARKGVDLALAARSAEDLDHTADRVSALGVRAVAIPTDVTDRVSLESLAERAANELGPVDLLVNNAGIEHYVHYERVELDEIEAIMSTNIIAAQLLTRLVLPGMLERKRGHIVNVSSLAGKTAIPYNVVYSSSKHALVGFSWSLREEVKPRGVGVSVICPSFVSETGMYATRSKGRPAPKVAGMVGPDDVANAVVKAVESNRAEILVARGLGKLTDVIHAISPELTTGIARRSGIYSMLEKAASREN
jgi:short-subunit dehydrogenase